MGKYFTGKYRKFWTALVGLLLITLDQFFQVTVNIAPETVAVAIEGLAVSFAVGAVPNDS